MTVVKTALLFVSKVEFWEDGKIQKNTIPNFSFEVGAENLSRVVKSLSICQVKRFQKIKFKKKKKV